MIELQVEIHDRTGTRESSSEGWFRIALVENCRLLATASGPLTLAATDAGAAMFGESLKAELQQRLRGRSHLELDAASSLDVAAAELGAALRQALSKKLAASCRAPDSSSSEERP
jgi:hypothetical protein